MGLSGLLSFKISQNILQTRTNNWFAETHALGTRHAVNRSASPTTNYLSRWGPTLIGQESGSGVGGGGGWTPHGPTPFFIRKRRADPIFIKHAQFRKRGGQPRSDVALGQTPNKRKWGGPGSNPTMKKRKRQRRENNGEVNLHYCQHHFCCSPWLPYKVNFQ